MHDEIHVVVDSLSAADETALKDRSVAHSAFDYPSWRFGMAGR